MTDILHISYSVWKQVVQNNSFQTYFWEDGYQKGTLWAGNRDTVYETRVVADTWEDFDTNFYDDTISVGRRDDAVAQIVGLSHIIPTPTTQDKILRVALEKGDAGRRTLISHNWADKTTWHSYATRVADEIATNTGDNQTYSVTNTNLIDNYHGKITNEDYILDSDGYSYRVVVKVNDEQKTEQDPHYGAGGDYTVDYADGYIEFLSALSPADEVKVTYHYATVADFIIAPNPGKMLKIEVVEVQFSEDVELTDSVRYTAYGNVEDFAPQYSPVPYPAGTPIPLGDSTVFKTIQDYMNDSIRAYPEYPAIGGNGWRGTDQKMVVMDWDYRSSIYLRSSMGMYLTLSLDHDTEFGGSFATATFYCKEEDET